MEPKVEVWTSGGVEHRITTEYQPPETPEAWQARHDEAVAYWVGIYPRD